LLIAAFFIHKDNLIKDLDTGYREPLKSRAEKGRLLTGIFVRYTWAFSRFLFYIYIVASHSQHMSTGGDPFDAMIKMFEEKKSVLIRMNQELQKLSGAAEISEYKRLAKDILRNHTLTTYSILSFLQMSVVGEAARQNQIAVLKHIIVQLQEVKNNPEMKRYIDESFDKCNKYLERYSYLSGFKA